LDKKEQLRVFLEASEDFINSKYILADIKIVNILKAIAQSETILALFKNSLQDFDYEQAKSKYLVKNKYFSGDKGEFILPTNSRELLAFVFNVLMDIDSKRVDFGEFINKYFFEDGSYSASFSSFVNAMIRPFTNTVKMLMTSVIEGKLQDPIEALCEEEERQARIKEEEEKQAQIDKELSKKTYGESIKELKNVLLSDKTKVKQSRLKEEEKEQVTLVIDTFANSIVTDDKDAIIYAYVTYRYMVKAHSILFFGRNKKVAKLLQGILNEL